MIWVLTIINISYAIKEILFKWSTEGEFDNDDEENFCDELQFKSYSIECFGDYAYDTLKDNKDFENINSFSIIKMIDEYIHTLKMTL